MATTGRSISIPYTPGPPPQEVQDTVMSRYVIAELNKIAEALREPPVALTVTDEGQYAIGPVINWVPMFVTVDALWDVPGGSWNQPVDGQYTCPQGGLYQLAGAIEVQPFGIGNKNYYAGIRLTIIHAVGPPDRVFMVTDGGDDDIPLGVTMNIGWPLFRGDVLVYEMTIVHENQLGTVDAKTSASVLRVSG